MLEPLVGHERRLRLLEPSDERSADAQVHDLGSDYRITLAGVERTHTDAARNCAERARVAAVFIALNLHAPAERAQPEATSAPAPAAAPTIPPRVRDTAPRITSPTLRWGLGAFASVGYVAKQQAVGGGGLEVWLQHRLWHVGLRATGLSAQRLAVSPRADGGHAQLLRAPALLFVGLLWRVSRLELGPSVGLTLDLLTARGRGLAASERIWRVNLGAQAGLDARYFLSERWALAARVDASFYPRAYTLRVEPEGREAHTPRIWLSAQLGVLVRVR
jgi:hypothetical protein